MKITAARGSAKVLGTIICIGGSLIFTFWKGDYQLKSFMHRPLINMYSSKHPVAVESWIKGSALILISYIAWSGWLILQVLNLNAYLVSDKQCVNCFYYHVHRLWSSKSTQLVYHSTLSFASSRHCNQPALPCSLEEIQPYGSWSGMYNS